MGLTATEQGVGKDFPPCPSGTHVARCVKIIDLGTHLDSKFNKLKNRIILFFELPNETFVFDDKKGPEPYMLKRKFPSTSLGENSHLRPALENWRGKKFTPQELKGFKLENVLDKTCMINVTHETKDQRTYAQIGGFSPLMKGMECPPRITPLVIYDVGQGEDETYKALPEWLRKEIAMSEEFKVRNAGPAHSEPEMSPAMAGPEDDQPPF